jgi:hypothetical protein
MVTLIMLCWEMSRLIFSFINRTTKGSRLHVNCASYLCILPPLWRRERLQISFKQRSLTCLQAIILFSISTSFLTRNSCLYNLEERRFTINNTVNHGSFFIIASEFKRSVWRLSLNCLFLKLWCWSLDYNWGVFWMFSTINSACISFEFAFLTIYSTDQK